MFAKKTYRDHGADRLLSYLDRTDQPIRDHTGAEMSNEDIRKFLDTSEKHEYEESWIFSPKNGDELSPDELSLAVRKTMKEHLDDRQRTTYCFSIHTDTDNHHAHIAATGDKEDLRTDDDDLERVRHLGAEHTHEAERDRDRNRDRDDRRARKNAREQGRDR